MNKTNFLNTEFQWNAVISHVCSNDARMPCHSGVTIGKECKSGLNQKLSYVRPVSETAFQACYMSLVR